jgi:O-antigen/teichoic acid export membrane protein
MTFEAVPREATLLPAVPSDLRVRIFAGIRWAVWLTALSTPFSYGITVILARTGPEALGTYGTLAVYLGAVTSFLYLGGDNVVIRFLPELSAARRASFLLSYGTIIAVWFAACLAILYAWPWGLRVLFGQVGDARFQFLLVCLAPICLFLNLVVGGLKGLLEIQLSHALVRFLTVAQCLVYAVLFLGFPGLLRAHYTHLVWGVYLALALAAAVLGLSRLLAPGRVAFSAAHLAFWLPAGFWAYTFSSQAVRVVWFFLGQLDSVLIINFGNLADLGRYLAIMSLPTLVRVASNLVIETLLPSLMNALASGGTAAGSEVFTMYWRLLLIVNTVFGSALVLFVGPVSKLLGPEYVSLQLLLVMAVLLVVLACPGWIGSSLLASVGQQHRSIAIGMGQLVLFVALFLAWWPKWRLPGAVLAYGLPLLASHSILLLVARRRVPLDFSAMSEYFKFAAVVTACAGLSARLHLSPPVALALWLLAVVTFLAWARYPLTECRALFARLVPGR